MEKSKYYKIPQILAIRRIECKQTMGEQMWKETAKQKAPVEYVAQLVCNLFKQHSFAEADEIEKAY